MREKQERLRHAIEVGQPVSALYHGYWVKLLPHELEVREEQAYLIAHRLPPPAQHSMESVQPDAPCERFVVDHLRCLLTSPAGRAAHAGNGAGS